MPELPEVETVKSVLIPIVKNRKIVGIDILRTTNVHSDPTTFKNELIGEIFNGLPNELKGTYGEYNLITKMMSYVSPMYEIINNEFIGLFSFLSGQLFRIINEVRF